MKYEPIVFPKDGLPHKCVVEWWYYNGFLQAQNGRRFAYMFCLFKVDNKKVAIPLLSHLPVKTVYFSHSLFTDIDAQKFYPSVNYFSVISKDSFKRKLLYVNFLDPTKGLTKYTNSEIEENPQFNYHLKSENFDLHLNSKKVPLLEAGTGFVELRDKSAYYYSLTDLETTGTIFLDGEEINVKGKSWMDHQWANTKYSRDRWTWFSLQLDNQMEIVCFEYGHEGQKDYLASLIDAQGRQEHSGKVILTPLDNGWKSQKTKNSYHLAWRIEIPEKKVFLEVHPEVKNQEMIFGAINYWEGPLKVEGTVSGMPVKGQGFLELVGKPLEYSALTMMSRIVGNIKNKII